VNGTAAPASRPTLHQGPMSALEPRAYTGRRYPGLGTNYFQIPDSTDGPGFTQGQVSAGVVLAF
jgi:hypothetical protein